MHTQTTACEIITHALCELAAAAALDPAPPAIAARLRMRARRHRSPLATRMLRRMAAALDHATSPTEG